VRTISGQGNDGYIIRNIHSHWREWCRAKPSKDGIRSRLSNHVAHGAPDWCGNVGAIPDILRPIDVDGVSDSIEESVTLCEAKGTCPRIHLSFSIGMDFPI